MLLQRCHVWLLIITCTQHAQNSLKQVTHVTKVRSNAIKPCNSVLHMHCGVAVTTALNLLINSVLSGRECSAAKVLSPAWQWQQQRHKALGLQDHSAHRLQRIKCCRTTQHVQQQQDDLGPESVGLLQCRTLRVCCCDNSQSNIRVSSMSMLPGPTEQSERDRANCLCCDAHCIGTIRVVCRALVCLVPPVLLTGQPAGHHKLHCYTAA